MKSVLTIRVLIEGPRKGLLIPNLVDDERLCVYGGMKNIVAGKPGSVFVRDFDFLFRFEKRVSYKGQ
jgi:hypothetical protein